MADNIAVDAGSGPSVATDDCGAGGHVQLVKIAYSADGVATLVTADADGVLVNLGTNNDVTVTGNVAVTNAGLTELAAAINASSQMDVNIAASGATVPVSGTFWQATQPVSLASVPSHAVTNAGTFATQVDGAALTALQLIDDPVFTDDAAFTLGTSEVMMGGGAVVAHGANPDPADAGDAGAFLMNRHRIPFVIGGHPNIVSLEYATTGAATDVALVTVGTGAKIVVTQIQAVVDVDNTAAVGLRVGFGAANTPTTTGVVMTHPGMAPGTGVSRGDGSGILGVGADNEDLRVTSEAPTGGSLRVLVSYYTIES